MIIELVTLNVGGTLVVIGVVISREDKEFNKLYMMADEMLYEVKRNGRNGFKIKNVL